MSKRNHNHYWRTDDGSDSRDWRLIYLYGRGSRAATICKGERLIQRMRERFPADVDVVRVLNWATGWTDYLAVRNGTAASKAVRGARKLAREGVGR